MTNGAMLNLYPDSVGGTLRGAADFLSLEQVQGAFTSVYLLPSLFDTDLDRGFSIASYDLSRTLADPDSLQRLKALGLTLKLDFVLNHLSVLSPQFQHLLTHGRQSPYADFFVDWNAFWQGHGEMTPQGFIRPCDDVLKGMFFRKPGLPFLMVRMPDGTKAPYWNTFYQEVRYPETDAQDVMALCRMQYGEAQQLAERINRGLSGGQTPDELDFAGFEACKSAVTAWLEARCRYLGQMDLNIRSPLVWQFYRETLQKLADYGASIVRLDAFAYAPKAVGKPNFMNEPDTWELLAKVDAIAAPLGLTLLPEIHAAYGEGVYRTVAEKGYMTYDFFLPGLLIDAIESHSPAYLARWAQEVWDGGIRTVNMLGCHDGIPVLDLKGFLPDERIQSIIDCIVSRGGLIKNLHGNKNLYYQVNATYFSALGEDERKMLFARAVQLFMPGKPQVWYLDLFAGKNDHEAVRRGGAAGHKEINRTNYTAAMIRDALKRPVVESQLSLLKLRNRCPAFADGASFEQHAPAPTKLVMKWQNQNSTATLEADFATYAFTAVFETDGKAERFCQEG